ncbi:Dor1-like family-domain-containing protein [Cladochytrium replicatum]|nr:Dor1-like family-domain-containing protein [Cladochytrium replicatum]
MDSDQIDVSTFSPTAVSSNHVSGHDLLIRILSTTTDSTVPVSPTSPQSVSEDFQSLPSALKDLQNRTYLDHLTSSSLDSIRAQPSQLSAEIQALRSRLAELAYAEYPQLLSANQSLQQIRADLVGQKQGVTRISSELLDKLANGIHEFSGTSGAPVAEIRKGSGGGGGLAAAIQADRVRWSRIYEQHPKILEILEIPQLMDTFIRNGYYDEAMELQSHVARLKLRHRNLAIVRVVADDVGRAAGTMLTQLVAVLRGDIALPMCIRVIGYLRKMHVFSEPDLRLLFLQERHAHFAGVLAKVKEQLDPVEYMKRYVEMSRESFFDIVTQYKVIFSDMGTGASGNRLLSSALDSPGFLDDWGSSISAESILSSYVAYVVQDLIAALRRGMPAVTEATTLHSIMTQCLYYGLSLGRLGIDCRLAIVSIMEENMERIVGDTIQNGLAHFLETAGDSGLEAFRIKSTTSVGLAGSHRSITGGSGPLNTVVAPLALMNCPPLAQLYNTFALAFNQLRSFPAISLMKPLGGQVSDSMIKGANAIVHLFEEAGSVTPPSMTQRTEWAAMSRLFVQVLVPVVILGFYRDVYGQNGLVLGDAVLSQISRQFQPYVGHDETVEEQTEEIRAAGIREEVENEADVMSVGVVDAGVNSSPDEQTVQAAHEERTK